MLRYATIIAVVGFTLLTGSAKGESTGSTTSPSEDETVVTLTNGEWPPYTSEHLPHYGFVSRIVSDALSLGGYYVEYEFVPWKRAYTLAVEGKRDGSVAWAPTPKRKNVLRFSTEVVQSKKVFFHLRKKTFDWSSINDLAQYSIGATNGYTYGPDFDSAWQEGKLKIQVVTTDAQNLGKLLLGRIDAFPLELAVGTAMINESLPVEQRRRITHHPKPILVTPIAVAISRQLPGDRADKILKALNDGLTLLQTQGTYEKYAEDMLY